jgi:hypothetical protein
MCRTKRRPTGRIDKTYTNIYFFSVSGGGEVSSFLGEENSKTHKEGISKRGWESEHFKKRHKKTFRANLRKNVP